MKITVEDVEHVAELARLELNDEEKASYATQLSAILAYFDKLAQVDTSETLPLSHPIDVENVFRSDEAGASLPTEQVLANAPEQAENQFRVPVILEH